MSSDGSLAMVTEEENGRFMLPMDAIWKEGDGIPAIFYEVLTTVGNPFKIAEAYCTKLFSNDTLKTELKLANFDAAVADLLYNECALALAKHLELPTVGFWAMSFAGNTISKVKCHTKKP